jgi:transcriptional regulator with XRE-family HTH domain
MTKREQRAELNMNPRERKKLEKAGWQIGSVAEFLDLTTEEAAYVELRVRLAEALKLRRRAANLSQKAFATAMKSSQSRVAKAEANHHSVSLDLLIRSLIALGVSLDELGVIIGLDEDHAAARTSSHAKPKRAATSRSQLHRKQPKQSRKNHKRSNVNAA